jgi:hypothetical protein
MRQTTLSVPLEVKPASCAQLTRLIDALRNADAPGYADQYERLHTKTPSLHFMSMSVFPNAAYDPLFVIEANFDGPPGVFWGQLEATLGPELREMLRCCKQPLDDSGPLFAAITAPDSRAPIAPYLERRTQKPSVFHHGNRGLPRDRILDEAALFLATRKELAATDPAGVGRYCGLSAASVHGDLRKALRPAFPWLDQPEPVRFPKSEWLMDRVRLYFFAVVAVFALSAPGLIMALITKSIHSYIYVYLVLVGLPTIVFAVLAYARRKPLPGTGVATRFSISAAVLSQTLRLVLAVALYVATATAIVLLPAMWLRGLSFRDGLHDVALWIGLGLLSAPSSLIGLLAWVRRLELRDSSQDAPPQDEETLRQIERREDWIAQNHMGSIVLIKPGVLRTILIKAGHLGLGLFLRVTATNGYLGSMRTVHFAHWAFVNNYSRLMFFSNFDHSWGSYLDDFIEKAAPGLTLAWGAGVGFPPARFLALDGASHGRQFKAWALASRAVSRFWYSAYEDLTVDQIERQTRIASGLRKTRLNDKEATAWLQDL